MRGPARAMTAECSHYETNLPDWADAVDEQADARKIEALQGLAGKDSKAYYSLLSRSHLTYPRLSNFPRSLGLCRLSLDHRPRTTKGQRKAECQTPNSAPDAHFATL